MPYTAGEKLPGERASKLGHLEVLKSPLVQQLVHSFEEEPADINISNEVWEPYPDLGSHLIWSLLLMDRFK